MKRSYDSFCTEMRLGSSITSGILLKLTRSRFWNLTAEDFAVCTRHFLLHTDVCGIMPQTSNLQKDTALVKIEVLTYTA